MKTVEIVGGPYDGARFDLETLPAFPPGYGNPAVSLFDVPLQQPRPGHYTLEWRLVEGRRDGMRRAPFVMAQLEAMMERLA